MEGVYFFSLSVRYILPGRLSLGEFAGEIDEQEVRTKFDEGLVRIAQELLKKDGSKLASVCHSTIARTYEGPKFNGLAGQEQDSSLWATIVEYVVAGVVTPVRTPQGL